MLISDCFSLILLMYFSPRTFQIIFLFYHLVRTLFVKDFVLIFLFCNLIIFVYSVCLCMWEGVVGANSSPVVTHGREEKHAGEDGNLSVVGVGIKQWTGLCSPSRLLTP